MLNRTEDYRFYTESEIEVIWVFDSKVLDEKMTKILLEEEIPFFEAEFEDQWIALIPLGKKRF